MKKISIRKGIDWPPFIFQDIHILRTQDLNIQQDVGRSQKSILFSGSLNLQYLASTNLQFLTIMSCSHMYYNYI